MKEKNKKLSVEKISNSHHQELYEVNDGEKIEMVRIFTKPGRRLITCTCFNGTKFCNEPTICKHKEAVIIWKNDIHTNIHS